MIVLLLFAKILLYLCPMVNVYLYVQLETEARGLAAELLKKQLVAHISIDYNNHVYTESEGTVKEEVTCLLTAQTKALLFEEITALVNNKLPGQVKIYSAPITQCNRHFSETIRTRTKAV